MAIIGIDFDNTIVCYDNLFYRAALDRQLIGEESPRSKEKIRDSLRAAGQEDDWTELQTMVYGKYIAEAQPFPGVREFCVACHQMALELRIVSHKTRRPYRGPQLDLRQAARDWLTEQQFLEPETGLQSASIYFEETKQDKLARIAQCGCDLFIDDLREFLSEPNFPPSVTRVHFDPHGYSQSASDVVACQSWSEVRDFVLDRFSP